jgi:CDP-4-dehydro-6-deoxyglucose reductase
MSEDKSQTAWHGISRDEINWHPTIEPELCIGCGMCVLGCEAGVYKFDYKKNSPVVAYPLRCKVGCTTCANTCPAHAISFPPLSYVHKLIKKGQVISTSKRDLVSKTERYKIDA